MKRNILLMFMLLVFTSTFAGEWKPNWKTVDLPNIEAIAYYDKHHSAQKSGNIVVWVYLNHGTPKQGKYFKKEKFLAEVQEWVLDCEKIEGSVATIRYTNSNDPNALEEFALVHPGGREIPTNKQIEVLCELNT